MKVPTLACESLMIIILTDVLPWEKSLRSSPWRENEDTFTYDLFKLIIQESWLLDTPSIP